MSGDKLSVFLSLVNVFDDHIVPDSDAADMRNGATFIPWKVTDARREGKVVEFVQKGSQKDWYWLMPNGEQIPHG